MSIMDKKTTKKNLKEALALSELGLQYLEKGNKSLSAIALICARLARLLSDNLYHQVMSYEASGYPSKSTGVPPETWKLLIKADRIFKDGETDYAYLEGLDEIEVTLDAQKTALSVLSDPSVQNNSPGVYGYSMSGNRVERSSVLNKISTLAKRVGQRRSFLYNYLLSKNVELKFSEISEDVFTRTRERVDLYIQEKVPLAIDKFNSIYEYLKSEDTTNWVDAVHNCRKILQELADVLYPVREDRTTEDGKVIRLGQEYYINRLSCYVGERSSSVRFNEIVGSHLDYLGNRLDAIYNASNKGTHVMAMEREEADRYVIYTYLLVGDIVSLDLDKK